MFQWFEGWMSERLSDDLTSEKKLSIKKPVEVKYWFMSRDGHGQKSVSDKIYFPYI